MFQLVKVFSSFFLLEASCPTSHVATVQLVNVKKAEQCFHAATMLVIADRLAWSALPSRCPQGKGKEKKQNTENTYIAMPEPALWPFDLNIAGLPS